MERAESDILSNSSMQQTPWSDSTSAPLSSTISFVSGSCGHDHSESFDCGFHDRKALVGPTAPARRSPTSSPSSPGPVPSIGSRSVLVDYCECVWRMGFHSPAPSSTSPGHASDSHRTPMCRQLLHIAALHYAAASCSTDLPAAASHRIAADMCHEVRCCPVQSQTKAWS